MLIILLIITLTTTINADCPSLPPLQYPNPTCPPPSIYYNNLCYFPSPVSITSTSSQKNLNQILITLTFSNKICNLSHLQPTVTADGQMTFQITKFTATTLQLTLSLQSTITKATICFENMSIVDQDNRYLVGICTNVSLLENTFYSEADLARMKSLVDLIKFITPTITSTSVLFLVTGSMFFIISILEFVQVPALYLYLDIPLPSNLRSVLQSFLQSQSVSYLPFTLPDPFHSLGTFHLPEPFSQLNLNFLSSSMWIILQTIASILLYWLLGTLFKYVNSPIGRKIHKRFKNGMYSNCTMVYQVVQVQLTFRAAASFRDCAIDGGYKVVNWGVSAVFMFFSSVGPFLHYVYMKRNKTNSNMFIEDCYSYSQRSHMRSEQYVISRIFCNTLLALTIATTNNWFCLISNSIFQLYHFYVLIRVTFSSRFLKFTRIIQALSQLTFHTSFMVFLVGIEQRAMLGLVCIGCLLSIVALEVLEVGFGVVVRLRKMMRGCWGKAGGGVRGKGREDMMVKEKAVVVVVAVGGDQSKNDKRDLESTNITIKHTNRAHKIKPLMIKFLRTKPSKSIKMKTCII